MNGIMGTRRLGLISALWPLTVETNAPFWPISAATERLYWGYIRRPSPQIELTKGMPIAGRPDANRWDKCSANAWPA